MAKKIIFFMVFHPRKLLIYFLMFTRAYSFPMRNPTYDPILTKLEWFYSKCFNQLELLNPWNHRADISAQAYLNPSKKCKKTCHRIVFLEYIIYVRILRWFWKKYLFFFGYLVRILRGVDFLWFFAEVLLPDKLFRN